MSKKRVRSCPACSRSSSVSLGKKNQFEIYRCTFCRTIFTDRIPKLCEAQNYHVYYDHQTLQPPAFIRKRVAEIVGEFEAFRNTNRILDIGFGAGTILEAASHSGWDVYGLEVSERAVSTAHEAGYKVFHGQLKEAQYSDCHFDVVTASEILEHLPDPAADLAEIARILRPGGLFWGTTPSAQAVSFRMMRLSWSMVSPPDHIQLYSKTGAGLMLTKAGFERIRLKTHGLNPLEIANHFWPRSDKISSVETLQAGYSLNEQLSRSPGRKLVRNLVNGALSIFGLGDSLKIYARKPH